jgi:hypothetical protein
VTRLLRTLLAAVVAALACVLAPVSLLTTSPASAAPACPFVSIAQSTSGARAVFSGTVSAVERQDRTDGVAGAIYVQTVTVSRVYTGRIDTENVVVQTDRNRDECSLGQLESGAEYMFFVTGNGDPWVASGTSGTRAADDQVRAAVERLLGPGSPAVAPAPEEASYTPVDTSDPQAFSRAAAPGAALVIVGLLGVAVVRVVSWRR